MKIKKTGVAFQKMYNENVQIQTVPIYNKAKQLE